MTNKLKGGSMDRERIEEAIEIVRYGRHEVTWTEEKAKEYREATDLLISLAQDYLKVARIMPRRKKIRNGVEDATEQLRLVGYNQALTEIKTKIEEIMK